MRPRSFLTALSTVVFVCTAPTIAAVSLNGFAKDDVTIVNPPGSPIDVSKCIGAPRGSMANPYTSFQTVVVFTNLQDAPLKAVDIRFEALNDAGTALGSTDFDITGSFGKGSAVQKSTRIGTKDVGKDVAKLRCAVLSATSQDGTVWKAPDQAAPSASAAPASTAAPKATPPHK